MAGGWARNADIGKPREQKGQATSAGEAVKTKTGLLACHHSILQTPPLHPSSTLGRKQGGESL